jgi:hypothetical protein
VEGFGVGIPCEGHVLVQVVHVDCMNHSPPWGACDSEVPDHMDSEETAAQEPDRMEHKENGAWRPWGVLDVVVVPMGSRAPARMEDHRDRETVAPDRMGSGEKAAEGHTHAEVQVAQGIEDQVEG